MIFPSRFSMRIFSKLWIRKMCNLCGCIMLLHNLRYYIFSSSIHTLRSLLMINTLLTIFLAELNRFLNERRRQRFRASLRPTVNSDFTEKTSSLPEAPNTSMPQCIAAIIGYREDPDLFKRVLASYKDAQNCPFTIIGIDGHEIEDQKMVQIFLEVCEYVSSAEYNFLLKE